MAEEKTTFCRIGEVYCGFRVAVEDGGVREVQPDPAQVVSRGYPVAVQRTDAAAAAAG